MCRELNMHHHLSYWLDFRHVDLIHLSKVTTILKSVVANMLVLVHELFFIIIVNHFFGFKYIVLFMVSHIGFTLCVYWEIVWHPQLYSLSHFYDEHISSASDHNSWRLLNTKAHFILTFNEIMKIVVWSTVFQCFAVIGWTCH